VKRVRTPCGLLVVGLALVLPVLAGAQGADPCAETVGMVTGTVTDGGSPLAGARVRVRTCLGEPVLTDAGGAFSLPVPAGSSAITAAAPGFYIGCWRSGVATACTPVVAGTNDLSIVLDRLPDDDDPAYQFRSPETCLPCHEQHYDDWNASTMAHTNGNRWVDNLYNGTDITMPPGPFTTPNDPPFSGFLQRHNVDAANPRRNGECANCHQPQYVGLDPTNTSYNDSLGPDRVGVGCDFCHKIVDVDVSEEGIRRPNLVVGEHGLPAKTTMLRSTSEPWVVFGPLDDVAFVSVPAMRASHAPVVRDSRLCATCHEDHTDFTDANGDFLEEYAGPGSQLTYSEWRDSPFAAAGVQCQDCHMPIVERGEICTVDDVTRDPSQIHSHRFEGTTPEFLRRAVDLDVRTEVADDRLTVRVDVANVGAGHHVPTGVTLRNMILVVDAGTADGVRLEQLEGRVVPNWGGVGDPTEGNFATLPGKGYARVLVDEFLVENVLFTEAVQAFDNRIPAGETDTSEYVFALPPKWQKQDVRADIRLYYRRAFKPIADQRKWNMPLGGNPNGTTGTGADYDENFVMAEARRFLTCRAKLKRVRGAVTDGRLALTARLKLPKGVVLDAERDGVRLVIGDDAAAADVVDVRLEAFERRDDATVVLTPGASEIVTALELTAGKRRKTKLVATIDVSQVASARRLRFALQGRDVCARKTLRCRTKRGTVRCR